MIDVSEKVQTSCGEILIGGSYQPRFEDVFKQFKNNFSSLGEIGASVSATLGGEVVIDLWGGIADTESRKPWTEKTLPVVWSSTKGATALCLHSLAFRGLLDLDAPVSEYWPEYGV
jgi:CubicO group peptidase (beta-lactamase class C family)